MPQNAYATPVITASGTTWAQLKAGGLAAVLANLATTNPAKANPTTAATVAVSGSAGLLPAGTYYARYSWVDAFGETLAGGESAVFTQTSGAKPAITIPALPAGVMSANIYLTAAGGVAGTQTLYATGITATSFTCDYAAPFDSAPGMPTANTTGWPGSASTLTVTGHTEGVLVNITEYLSQYTGGNGPTPTQRREVLQRFNRQAGVLAAWAKAMAEVNVLIAANPPTGFTSTPMATGMPSNKWAFP